MSSALRQSASVALPSDSASIESRGSVGKLSLIVPCHNEAPSLIGLKAALDRLQSELSNQAQLHLLLIDDGSTDGTAELMRDVFKANDNATIVHHSSRQGIAAAIATGLAHTDAEIAASIDADCTYDPTVLAPMLQLLHDDVDLVVASPYHPHGGVEGVAPWRLAISRMASRLYRLVMRNKLHTYTSCVRVYRRRSVVDLPVRSRGFVGIVELLWHLDRRGGKIVEYPAVLRTRKTGQSKMRVFRATLAHLRLLSLAALIRMFGSRHYTAPGQHRS